MNIPQGVLGAVRAVRDATLYDPKTKKILPMSPIAGMAQTKPGEEMKFLSDPNNQMAIAGMVGPVSMASPMVGFQEGKALTDATGSVSSRYLIKPINDLISHEKVDPSRVRQYVEYMSSGRDIEPLKILREGAKYGVEDGKHRLAAMKELGFTHAPVELLRRK